MAKITIQKDISGDVLQVLEEVKALRNDFVRIGGFMQEGYRDATKKQVIARVDDFIKGIDNIDVDEIVSGLKD